MQNEKWISLKMYCPNCGKLINGYKNSSGKIKYECERCKTVAVRTPKGRRHDEVHIYAPQL